MTVLTRLRNDSGAAAVEFALVALILFTLLFGVVQFGFTFWEYIQVAHSAREGARWAALGATQADAISRAKSASPGLDEDVMQVTVLIVETAEEEDVYSARVTVQYPRTKLLPIPGLPDDLQSVAELKAE